MQNLRVSGLGFTCAGAALVAIFAGCSSQDASTSSDGGTSSHGGDAGLGGETGDAGGTPSDASTPSDGSTPTDSGVTTDGGTPSDGGHVGPTCVKTSASANLETIVTNGSDALTTDTTANNACTGDVAFGSVNGICYGNYAVQSNSYGTPPANTSFGMWSNSSSCWGIDTTEAANPSFVYWNAPLATRGFSFGAVLPLTATGGLLVSKLDSDYAAASTHCPAGGTTTGVCVQWSMSVPGAQPSSIVNTAAKTYTNWDALIDIYFHGVAEPTAGQSVTFDLQIYQMVMDWQNGSVPNWASYIVGTHTTKTIGGITYLVSVNMGNPGTEGSSWVGSGGTLNSVSMIPLPTYPTTTPSGSGSYLWGTATALHDVAGIIAWLSETTTSGGKTGIFDDAGKLLYDNVRKASVTAPLITPSYYLTGLNPGFEVVQADPGASYPGNTSFTTTDLWVALPGETLGD